MTDVAGADEQTLIYARELARLQALRRAYEQLLPAALDPSSPQDIKAEVREATVVFTDIRGFTGLSERMAADPEALLAVINAHFEVVVNAVNRTQGVVEKFVGDGALITFGARVDQPDSGVRAISTAMAVIGANEMLNRRHSHEWGLRLDVGVGVAGGQVIVGRVGAPSRSELGILGDPVNIAARLVARAGAGEVLIEASVFRGLGGSLRADLLGPQAVRGRVGEIEVFRLPLLEPPAQS